MIHESEDGRLFDTDRAERHWEEDTYHDGNNQISCATGSQWNHQDLYLSSKGQYYVIHSSDMQGSTDAMSLRDPKEAAKWLLKNERELPEDLKQFETDVVE